MGVSGVVKSGPLTLAANSVPKPLYLWLTRFRTAMSDEIDYRLIGDDLQAVIITLDPNEMVIAEAGAMMYMEDGIVMQTTLDPNATGSGLMGKLLMGAKRAL